MRNMDVLEQGAQGYRGVHAAPDGVLVLDPVGEVFDRVRELALPAPLWRVVDAHRIAKDLRAALAVYASYGAVDWPVVGRLDACGPTVLITTTYRRDDALEALRRDLVGCLDATLPREALARAMRGLLLRKEHAFPREVLGSFVWQQRLDRETGPNGSALTPRQNEIVALIARGATDKEIAGALGIATATAQKHVTNILERLQVPNRAAAVAVTAATRPAWAA